VTAGFTENGYLLPVVFRRGFDRFDASKRAHIGVIEATFEAARTWLRGHAANEFFLFVHTYQVARCGSTRRVHRCRRAGR